MIDKFSQINFSDAEILKVQIKNGDLNITIKDWQEKEMMIVFREVVGFESFSPEGEDISHGSVNFEDKFIERACNIANDEAEGVACFKFWSSWSNESVLTIAARDFEIVSM
jgi:hypothetical protein